MESSGSRSEGRRIDGNQCKSERIESDVKRDSGDHYKGDLCE